MSYSSLTSCVLNSPNCTKLKKHNIDTITIHHVAGKTEDGCAAHCIKKRTARP